jgi:hypothetical protein
MKQSSKQGTSNDVGVVSWAVRGIAQMCRLGLLRLARELQSCRVCHGHVFLLDDVCRHCGVANPVIVGCSRWVVATAAVCEIFLIWLCLH